MPGPTDPQQLLSDLQRQVANLVRVGTIAEVDHGHTPPLVRVQLTDDEDHNNARSDWRPYIERRAGDTGTWNPPTVGECVLLISPGGLTEAGFALPGIPTDSHPTPSSDPNKTVTKYPDGAIVEYDHGAHALKVTLPAGGTADIDVPDSINVHCKTADVTADESVTVNTQQATVKADDLITLDSPRTHVTGELIVEKLATLNGGFTVNSTGPGGSAKARLNVDVEVVNGHGLSTDGGDIVAGDISLQNHLTSEVEPGGGTSGKPTP
ncbi:phage baseplate assembly protein V [Variovorax ureilyticus]|uniref:phage baseplate assembly protein V n=1 Tax=Variovorax ureilyticus TaxID=1836198 RepID=UPI003D663E6B